MNTLLEQLLHYAKTGSLSLIQCLLQLRIEQDLRLNINCRGKTKTSAGWTPLHLACYYGHKDVVEELLKAGADVNLQNSMGDTPLHKAALAGRKEVVLLLLRYDASSTIINGKAQIPKAVTEDDEINTMLEAAERRAERRQEEKLLEAAREGDVFTLSELLSRKRPPDIDCRDLQGNTPLHCAAYRGQKQCVGKLLKCGASSSMKNKSGIGTLIAWILHLIEPGCSLKSSSLKFHNACCCWCDLFVCVCVQRWLDALEEHTAYSSCNTTQEQTTEDEEGDEATLGDLTDSLQAAEVCQQKLETQVCIFLSMVKNEENNSKRSPIHVLTAPASASLSHLLSVGLWPCLDLTVHAVWSLKLEQEVEKNKLLTEALQTLATEHQDLDQQSLCKGRRSSTLSTLTEDDFYDALSGQSNPTEEEREPSLFSSSTLRGPAAACDMSGEVNHGDKKAQCNGVKKHRTSLPAPMFSRNDVSVWSILKKCIGMELSKIAMPVIFNEPLSFLQRLTEYMEHTYLIHQANAATDSMERMKCVAAFAVSAVASQWERTGKPFNPLLGETYELIREDLGFRWMSEQVSHHPPVSAFHAEGLQEDFLFHGSIYPKLKFWGKSVEAEPKGIITLELPKCNEAYTWTNPTCCVHNIIVGQLWIEQYGNVEVINHKTGERCSLTFKPCGMFGKELHKVEGYILDKSKKKLCAIYGKWTECLYTVDAATFDAHKKNSEEKKSNTQTSVDEEPEEMPLPDGDTVQVIPGSELIWRIVPRPDNSAQFYAFSTFAMQLNELEGGMKGVLPPTDCRLRPDIRAMEKGDIDLASAEKKRVEEKQRLARKNRSKSTEEWKTRWFHQGSNPHIKAQDWLYSNGYWERNYSLLPDIY
uniref:Oxysterol-binding protein n=1 Tax=Oncorhynchus tshawytscha TaxID=74940 RepID=A0A8C8JY43_ONCTS